MATSIHKLLKKHSSALRIITTLNHKPLNLPIPLVSQNPDGKNPSLLFGYLDSNDTPFSQFKSESPSLQIYPSFRNGFPLNPHSPARLEDSSNAKVQGFDSGEGHMIWADSVKKKRKRKMNKHKLRKLRKRLRRKT